MNEQQKINQSEEEVLKSRRRLPHWEYSDSIYFITWRLHKNQSSLIPEERSLVVEVLKYFDEKRYSLFSFVIMDDHVHVLVRLGTRRNASQNFAYLEIVLRANRLQRKFKRTGLYLAG